MNPRAFRVVILFPLLLAAFNTPALAQEKQAPRLLPLTAKEQAAAEFRAGLESNWQWASGDALAHMKKALEIDPSFGLARAYVARFERRNTAAELQRALSDAGQASAPEVLFILGLRESQAGRTGRLGPMLELAMKYAPDDPYLALEHAFAFGGKDRIEWGRKVTTHFPDFANGHATLAYFLTSAYANNKDADLQEAWQHAQEALRLAPDKPTSHISAAHVLQRMGKIDEASAQLAGAMDLQPAVPYAFHLAADIAASKKQFAEARRLMTRALETDSWAVNAAYYERAIALAHMREGNPKLAIAALDASAQKAIAADMKASASVQHVFCALLVASIGDKTAMSHFAEAKRLGDISWGAHNEVFSAAMLGDAAAARAAMQRYGNQPAGGTPEAMEARTKMLHAMEGMILLAEKKPQEALTEFKQAADSPWGNFGMAEAYKALGMKKEMKAERERFLSRPEPGLGEAALLPIALNRWR